MSDLIPIETRREPFVDAHPVERFDGAELRTHPPQRREVVFQVTPRWRTRRAASIAPQSPKSPLPRRPHFCPTAEIRIRIADRRISPRPRQG